jgi:hypothetical protein
MPGLRSDVNPLAGGALAACATAIDGMRRGGRALLVDAA